MEVLLVEDNHYEAKLTVRALQKNKLANKIIWLKDGEEALDYLFIRGKYADRDFSGNPKLILLDLKLPKVDGLEVLRQIKSNEETKTIPVVVLTSSTEKSDLRHCYQAGANSYISKPVNFENFSDCAKEIGFYWLLVNQLDN